MFSKKVTQGRFEVVFQKTPSRKIWDCFPKSSLKEESSGNFSGGFLENISHQKLLRMSLRGDFAKYPFDEKACIPIFYPLGIWRRSNMTSENLRKVLTFQKLHVSQELKKSTNLVFFHLYIVNTCFMLYQKIHSGPTNGCFRDKMAFYLVHEVRRCNNYDSPSSKSCSYFDVLEKTYFEKSRWQEIKRSWFLSISSHFQIHCQLRRDISPWGSKGYNGWIKRNRDLETFVFPRLPVTFNTYSVNRNWTIKWVENKMIGANQGYTTHCSHC